ncbi:MAG: hypothetical protein K2O12_02660, partial [Muribaculaceae bacterium]|nr:hypothetical protein [Muribaculaceae bacterium]
MKHSAIYILSIAVILTLVSVLASCGSARRSHRSDNAVNATTGIHDSLWIINTDRADTADSLGNLSIIPEKSLPVQDSSGLASLQLSDSTANITRDTSPYPDDYKPKHSRIVRKKVDLDHAVTFSSSDSLILVRRDSAYMYGDAVVTYDNMRLDAARLDVDLNGNTVFAQGTPDEIGELTGTPV